MVKGSGETRTVLAEDELEDAVQTKEIEEVP